ncbi:MAG: chromate transporter [Absicoccus sp.]|uniref:chromate transporter n=1 Tax=Absicoccus sp. TaxID=2718527 RepID=UPI002A753FC5|nr:chromate transporter [Absicoccus sp.]MDY3036106.1 chromate transporter [Absicoccus sp.]
MNIYITLFISFIWIGAFSFGGGYAALPLIKEQTVTIHHWLSMKEFTNLITISQMTPGPIAINSATFVGQKVAVLGGAVACTLGCIAPSLILVTILAKIYFTYRNLDVMKKIFQVLRPIVLAMILGSGLLILQGYAKNVFLVILTCVCLLLARKTKLNLIWIMIIGGLCNIVFHCI